ncbi:MAG: restriction endonuclease subunit S [Ruminococcaceae bacterium]|nr:restriction endonuclease subunit S [Oscillospiraceae bacterium]
MSWETKKLCDCCVSIADGDHQAPPKSDSGIPFVTISNINASNQFDFTDTMFVPQEYYGRLDSKRKAQKGDILYSVVGSFGIPVFMKETIPFVFQRHIAILRPNDTILPRFLYYTMLSRDFYMMADAAALGAAQRTVSLTALRNMKIAVPPMDKQKRIVDVLSAYDDLIENNQKQIRLLEEAAQRLYKEWFVDLRFPGHETTPILNGLPESWEIKSMDDIADYINGYAFKPSDWGAVGKPIIKIKEMGSGITADTPRNTGESIPEKYNVSAGDILFSWSATLSAMIWDEEDGLLNQHLFKVIPHDGISREFVLQSILKTLDEFSNLTTGATMKHIQRGKLKEVKINVPTAELMEQYKTISEPIRESILNIKRQMILLREARDRLLPKLMNGEIEV